MGCFHLCHTKPRRLQPVPAGGRKLPWSHMQVATDVGIEMMERATVVEATGAACVLCDAAGECGTHERELDTTRPVRSCSQIMRNVLTRNIRVLACLAFATYIGYEACWTVFGGASAPTIAIRVLCATIVFTLDVSVWINISPRVLRILCVRARCASVQHSTVLNAKMTLDCLKGRLFLRWSRVGRDHAAGNDAGSTRYTVSLQLVCSQCHSQPVC